MSTILIFGLGVIVGSCFGVIMMCILIGGDKYNDEEEE